jgi:thymidylate synthase
MRQYHELVRHVLETGTRKENRTGVDTISTFNYNFEHDMREGFPLLTTKAVSWKNIVIEMLWFLSGQTDISILKRHGCKFWDAWADENGKVPSAYGSFWTNFPPGQEPEAVAPREPSGNDYVKPTFDQVSAETGHDWCGQTFESQKCGSFRVIRHVGSDAESRSLFDIQFIATGYIKRAVRRDVIQQGTVRDRYTATTHGVGYYGERTTRTAIDKDLLKVWLHMLDRCYNPDCKEFPYYGLKGVTVCKRWHNFDNFHADCQNLPNWINKRDNPKKYALDKDFYSARCYSPTTCVWLLHTDNRLYAHAKAVRVEYPDGEVTVVLSVADAAATSKLNKSRVLTCIERGESFRGFKFSWAGVHRKPLPNNQIAWVLAELQRNPMSRRIVVSAWAPGNAQTSKLPPCHCLFMFNVQNEPILDMKSALKSVVQADVMNALDGAAGLPQTHTPSQYKQRLCLHLTQRSADVGLGVPYNIASYALLLSLFSHFSGIEPGIFAHTLVDAHIYTAKPDGSMAEFDHIPGLKEQITRKPEELPKLIISPEIKTLADIERLMAPEVTTDEVMKHFVLEGYEPAPAINFKVAV